MVIGQSAADLNAQMDEISIVHLGQPSDMSKFDLTFDCEEGADFATSASNTTGSLRQRAGRPDGRALRVLLSGALRNPALSVHALPLLQRANGTSSSGYETKPNMRPSLRALSPDYHDNLTCGSE